MMDNSAREYLFCLEFFGMPEERALKFFGEVMVRSLSHVFFELTTQWAYC